MKDVNRLPRKQKKIAKKAYKILMESGYDALSESMASDLFDFGMEGFYIDDSGNVKKMSLEELLENFKA